MDRSKHYAGIDVVRFAAAVLVMFLHLDRSGWQTNQSWVNVIVAPPPGLQPPAFGAWLGSFRSVGVEIFFVISGLVIANSAATTTPIAFAKSRIYRLYPAVWICATISAASLLALGLSRHLMTHYLAALLLVPMKGFLVYWTLGVEVMFYATVFFWKLRFPKLALVQLASILVIWSGLYNLALVSGWHGIPPLLEGPSMLRHGVFFALGIYLWAATERMITVRDAFLAALAFCLCVSETMQRLHCEFFSPAIVTWLIAVALIGLSTSKRASSLPLPPSLAAALRTIGLMTYPLYLMHVEFGGACLHALLRLGLQPAPAIALAMLAAIAVAYAVASFGEKAIRQYLKQWLEQAETLYLRNRPAFAPLYRTAPQVDLANSPPPGP